MESSGVLPTIHFHYRKGLGTVSAWVPVINFFGSHTLLSASESGRVGKCFGEWESG